MAKGTYFQKGESLDYTNTGSAKIGFGDVIVIGSHIGIAGDDIAAGETGAVHVTGVFMLPKADSGAIAVGTDVKWDNANGVAAAAGSGDTVIGYAAAAAAAADTSVFVKLNG